MGAMKEAQLDKNASKWKLCEHSLLRMLMIGRPLHLWMSRRFSILEMIIFTFIAQMSISSYDLELIIYFQHIITMASMWLDERLGTIAKLI